MTFFRNVINNHFRLARGFYVAVLVREPNHAVAVADVNPFRIGTGRIEGDAIGLAKSRGENSILLNLGSTVLQTVNANLVGLAVSHEDVAVRRYPDRAWRSQFRRPQVPQRTLGAITVWHLPAF